MRPQPRRKADPQSRLRPAWGYAVTSATFALEVRPDGQQSGAHRASVPNQLRDRGQIDTALLDRARDSVHKSSPNPDRVMVPASVVWAPAFRTPGESLKPDWNPEMVDVRQAR